MAPTFWCLQKCKCAKFSVQRTQFLPATRNRLRLLKWTNVWIEPPRGRKWKKGGIKDRRSLLVMIFSYYFGVWRDKTNKIKLNNKGATNTYRQATKWINSTQLNSWQLQFVEFPYRRNDRRKNEKSNLVPLEWLPLPLLFILLPLLMITKNTTRSIWISSSLVVGELALTSSKWTF